MGAIETEKEKFGATQIYHISKGKTRSVLEWLGLPIFYQSGFSKGDYVLMLVIYLIGKRITKREKGFVVL